MFFIVKNILRIALTERIALLEIWLDMKFQQYILNGYDVYKGGQLWKPQNYL